MYSSDYGITCCLIDKRTGSNIKLIGAHDIINAILTIFIFISELFTNQTLSMQKIIILSYTSAYSMRAIFYILMSCSSYLLSFRDIYYKIKVVSAIFMVIIGVIEAYFDMKSNMFTFDSKYYISYSLLVPILWVHFQRILIVAFFDFAMILIIRDFRDKEAYTIGQIEYDKMHHGLYSD